ncbi:MAG: HAD-IA family hydrolase [Candidatus Obscuribacterales bacterium]|nr:HAD-IA family hydrolase [Candidatus Obscuribacterales bacterium]
MTTTSATSGYGLLRKTLCWGVHLYTGLGLVCAAAIAALIVQGGADSFRWAFIIMGVALFIDATDGTLARRLEVKKVLPGFDGRRLDDIIDFLTYTGLPLLLVYRAGIMPAGWDWTLMVAAMASLYGFCQTDIKTADGYFLGFPSYWNLVAFYLYVLPGPAWLTVSLVLGLALLTFVPTRYLYPSQGGWLNNFTNVLGGLWGLNLAWVVWCMPAGQFPGAETFTAAAISLFFPVWYVAASFAVEAKVRMNSRATKFDAAVFDMDGTLDDSEPVHCLAYQQVLERLGKTLTSADYNSRFTGSTDQFIATSLIQQFGLTVTVAELLKQKEALFLKLIEGRAEALPGVLKTLDTLHKRGLKLAVASSATLDAIEAVLAALKIRHYFTVIASGEEVANSKPAPDVFLLAAERLGIAPQRCLAFEDSENGVRAAAAAGLFCIAIPCGSTAGQDHSAAKMKLASMADFDANSVL